MKFLIARLIAIKIFNCPAALIASDDNADLLLLLLMMMMMMMMMMMLWLVQLTLVDEQFLLEDKSTVTSAADLCSESRMTAQHLLSHYVHMQGLAISQACLHRRYNNQRCQLEISKNTIWLSNNSAVSYILCEVSICTHVGNNIHCEAKKLHRFIFAITFSNRDLFR